MRKILLAIAMVISLQSIGQVQSATLVASGLTCSMCSKAIYKSLVKVPTVQDVKADIKNSSYTITFKPAVDVSPEALKKAVEDAGFSVASLKITANFDKAQAGSNITTSLQGSEYTFINSTKQVLQGVKTFTIVDKNYMSADEHKKYEKTYSQALAEGKAYHVIL